MAKERKTVFVQLHIADFIFRVRQQDRIAAAAKAGNRSRSVDIAAHFHNAIIHVELDQGAELFFTIRTVAVLPTGRVSKVGGATRRQHQNNCLAVTESGQPLRVLCADSFMNASWVIISSPDARVNR